MKTQNFQIEKMQIKIKDILGNDAISKAKNLMGKTNTNIRNLENIINYKNTMPLKNESQPKTSKILFI
jgi:hypothetical protein